MPVVLAARPEQGTAPRHSRALRRRTSTQDVTALLRTLPRRRAPEPLRARLLAIPQTELART